MSTTETKPVENLLGDLTNAVFLGNSLPAHDQVFDAAEALARTLSDLHAYVASVRDTEQADAALVEMGKAVACAVTGTGLRELLTGEGS
jgi:hypothetical protein